MEYKDMINKVSKMHNYYTNDGLSTCSDDCPFVGSNGLCKAGHSMFYLASESEPGLSDEIERIVSEWVKPVDWVKVADRAKTEDIKVLVWDDEKTMGHKSYLCSYDPDTLFPFTAYDDGRTKWTKVGVTKWKHAELVEE